MFAENVLRVSLHFYNKTHKTGRFDIFILKIYCFYILKHITVFRFSQSIKNNAEQYWR